MSLTSFLENPDVKEKFKQQFPKPKFTLQKEILAPPRTKRYSLVGTAFDYLLRFYIERLIPNAITKTWVAEHALTALPLLARIASDTGGEVVLNGDTREISIINFKTGETIPHLEIGIGRKVKQIIEYAKMAYNTYLSSGQITDELLERTLLLAQVDPIFRAGRIDDNLGIVDIEDIADLRTLISIVQPEIFRANELCLLNPTFGEASRLVGGADADLLIDGTLIDVKTTKDLRLQLDHVLQLMGYYVLFKIAGVDGAPHQPTIERIGIYYSRYAELYTIPIADVVNNETLPPFIEWFKERASAKRPH